MSDDAPQTPGVGTDAFAPPGPHWGMSDGTWGDGDGHWGMGDGTRRKGPPLPASQTNQDRSTE